MFLVFHFLIFVLLAVCPDNDYAQETRQGVDFLVVTDAKFDELGNVSPGQFLLKTNADTLGKLFNYQNTNLVPWNMEKYKPPRKILAENVFTQLRRLDFNYQTEELIFINVFNDKDIVKIKNSEYTEGKMKKDDNIAMGGSILPDKDGNFKVQVGDGQKEEKQVPWKNIHWTMGPGRAGRAKGSPVKLKDLTTGVLAPYNNKKAQIAEDASADKDSMVKVLVDPLPVTIPAADLELNMKYGEGNRAGQQKEQQTKATNQAYPKIVDDDHMEAVARNILEKGDLCFGIKEGSSTVPIFAAGRYTFMKDAATYTCLAADMSAGMGNNYDALGGYMFLVKNVCWTGVPQFQLYGGLLGLLHVYPSLAQSLPYGPSSTTDTKNYKMFIVKKNFKEMGGSQKSQTRSLFVFADGSMVYLEDASKAMKSGTLKWPTANTLFMFGAEPYIKSGVSDGKGGCKPDYLMIPCIRKKGSKPPIFTELSLKAACGGKGDESVTSLNTVQEYLISIIGKQIVHAGIAAIYEKYCKDCPSQYSNIKTLQQARTVSDSGNAQDEFMKYFTGVKRVKTPVDEFAEVAVLSQAHPQSFIIVWKVAKIVILASLIVIALSLIKHYISPKKEANEYDQLLEDAI